MHTEKYQGLDTPSFTPKTCFYLPPSFIHYYVFLSSFFHPHTSLFGSVHPPSKNIIKHVQAWSNNRKIFKHATNSHDGADIFSIKMHFDVTFEKLLDGRSWDRGQMKLQTRAAIVHKKNWTRNQLIHNESSETWQFNAIAWRESSRKWRSMQSFFYLFHNCKINELSWTLNDSKEFRSWAMMVMAISLNK